MKQKIFLLIILLSLSGLVKSQVEKINSPDGSLAFELYISSDEHITGGLFYEVTKNGKTVLNKSRLDLVMYNKGTFKNFNLCQNLEVIDKKVTQQDTTWKPLYGERSKIVDRFRQLVITFNNTQNGQKFNFIIRAYNGGIAFRYEFPEKFAFRSRAIDIIDEKSHFAFPSGTKAWHTSRAQAEYELVELNNWKSESARPVTLELPDELYASVGEAQMVNYSRMRLKISDKYANTMVSSLGSRVIESSPFASPWRIVMVAEHPGKLVESNDIYLNLNPPNEIAHTWWIQPGKVIREVTLSDKGAKACVDFAVEHGLDYIHFDAGWYGHEYELKSDPTTVTVDPRRNPKGDLDLHKAIRYAKSNGIGVIVYVNRKALESKLDEILPLYKSWGIDGIKYGFVQVGTHRWTVWLHEAVKKAAAHQLMVNIHDEYRPTGFSRTYPNLMTQEGILGNEGMPTATHNTILPFTRYLCGAADYTVCYYHRKEFGHENTKHLKTTPAHQLALSVIYYSPLQWLFWYDEPSDYQGEPEIEFFKEVPTVWEETRFISGDIGEYVTMARRSGNDWFIGSITNDSSRNIDIEMAFLDSEKKYIAKIYMDGGAEIKTRTHVKIVEKEVKKGDQISLSLKSSGGAAIHISEIN